MIYRQTDTAKGDAGGSNDAGLDNSVLLPGEGLFEEAIPVEELGPSPDKEEAQESSRDVERRNNTDGEVELHHYHTEEHAQHKAYEKRSHSQLLLP